MHTSPTAVVYTLTSAFWVQTGQSANIFCQLRLYHLPSIHQSFECMQIANSILALLICTRTALIQVKMMFRYATRLFIVYNFNTAAFRFSLPSVASDFSKTHVFLFLLVNNPIVVVYGWIRVGYLRCYILQVSCYHSLWL